CLTPRGLMYVIHNKTVLIKRSSDLISKAEETSLQQQKQIRGRILDEFDAPLAGVSIRIAQSNIATATDADGNFTLTTLQDEGQLIISALGYEEKTVGYKVGDNVYVTLQAKSSSLDEVVIVGYGVQKKANLTGAVSQINAEDIALRPDANIAGTLQGLMPGLNIQLNNGDPSETPDINVRGFNSINGGGPLILIDGIEGNITRVNPNDI